MMVLPWPKNFYPVINDIITNGDSPLVIERDGEEIPYDHAMLKKQLAAYPDIRPLTLKNAPQSVFDLVHRTALSMEGWEIVRADKANWYLQAVATTPLLRFKDDVAVQVTQGESGGSVVEMRSRSRVGKGDLGANAKRIRKFFNRLRNLNGKE